MRREARFLSLENAERQVGRNPKFHQLERVRRSWAGFRALVGTEPVKICGATRPRLGPIPRPIAHRVFCSGMWRAA